jgi:hypothetical protein
MRRPTHYLRASANGSQFWAQALNILKEMLSLGSLIVNIVLAFLSVACTNLFLFRKPLAYASELEPMLVQARNCQEEARLFLCAGDRQHTSTPLPDSLFTLQKLWERYLDVKVKEWSSCSNGAAILVG